MRNIIDRYVNKKIKGFKWVRSNLIEIKTKIVSKRSPQFTCNGGCLQFVGEFQYLGHVIFCSLNDDKDIEREICSTYK